MGPNVRRMAVDVGFQGDRDGAERLIAALAKPWEMTLKSKTYPMRGVPAGVRRFGQARPRAGEAGKDLAVREAVLALPLGPAEPSVRIRLSGEEADVVALLIPARDLLRVKFHPRAFPADGRFGIAFYLHVFTGDLPEPPAGGAGITEVSAERGGRRRGRWVPSERADRRTLPGRRALPGGAG